MLSDGASPQRPPTPASSHESCRPLAACLLVACCFWLTARASHAEEADVVRYDRDIRPLLSDRCFTCHGPDPAKRKARLRLDTAEGATRSRRGTAAIVPGNLEESELWYRLTTDDEDDHMPPARSNKKDLTVEELELIRRWIEQGADYEDHWSFVAPQRPDVPAPDNHQWARGEIDRFILATLESHDIEPSPEADPHALLRRVFLDLTGLPPTPEETAAYLADTRPDRYERMVDRLLHDEPYVSRYAERMAVPWLDAARYADTSGLHMDAGRQMWAWRDWVLHALREGMPYDQFLTEQLAGDLLPDATLQQKIASGFNRNHVTTDEGGAIADEYLVEYAVDRAATTGEVFLGLTMGCARCHDHKFDPISQQEFFSFYSFFNSIEEPGLYSQVPDANRALEPFIEVPSPTQAESLTSLHADLDSKRAQLDTPIPGEAEARSAFFAGILDDGSVSWAPSVVVGQESSGGATLQALPDGSVLATGENPGKDTHTIRLDTTADTLRLITLEALPHESLPVANRPGRAANGNAVLESIRVEAVSIADPEQRTPVALHWAWADVEQTDGNFGVLNALADDDVGWAIDAHRQDGPRVAMFLADEPFGYEGGTRLIVRLDYDSQYTQHAFGCVRLAVGNVADPALDRFGTAMTGWYSTATFRPDQGTDVFDAAFGPETMVRLDPTLEFGEEKNRFNFIEVFRDERINNEFAANVGVTYVARRFVAPSEREFEVSIGSDDGFRIFVDGREIAKKKVSRGAAPDQDRIKIAVDAGDHTVVFKIVNTGGPAAYYWRTIRRDNELNGPLLAAFLPEATRSESVTARLHDAWRLEFSPEYRARRDLVTAAEKALSDATTGIPRTMVMKELAMPRDTYVLNRGQYDEPDMERPVMRGIPATFGALPDGAPTDRRGLAMWMTSPENPLVARVAVNRLWERCFGTGIVATSEDFGMQSEWPSHPELLDWLAVEFRESGWDMKALLRRIVTSATYRQSSRVRPELSEIDPDDRLLASFPRRRLGAEQIRDQVLYVSGLLVEEFGGPSVKPYQPEGLWREVAMLQSNTRNFERGEGDELWRRSLYTYWKRAAPPPSMLMFDAPTREFCTIRRGETTTPLQALVLWNDEQFVEAARKLAERTIAADAADAADALDAPDATDAPDDSDSGRLARMFLRCTGRMPDDREAGLLLAALNDYRARYAAAPADAAKLLEVGMAPTRDGVDPVELAAWTMIANTLFSLDSMISKG